MKYKSYLVEYAKDVIKKTKDDIHGKYGKEKQKEAKATLMLIGSLLAGNIAMTVPNSIINNKIKNDINDDILTTISNTDDNSLKINDNNYDINNIIVDEIASTIETDNKKNATTYKTEPLVLIQNYISKYSKIFEVDYEKISVIVNNSNIEETEEDKIEDAVFFKVLDIVYNPEKYNTNDEELRSYKDYEIDKSPEELIAIYSNKFNINPFIPMSIAYNESGNELNSDNFIYNNNIGGIGEDAHHEFRNKETGIIYLCYLLKTTYGVTMNDTIDKLNDISTIYCCDKDRSDWIYNTKDIYKVLTTEGYLQRAIDIQNKDTSNFVVGNFTYDEFRNNNNSLLVENNSYTR